MAKRFTDTKKWEDPWFYELPLKMKLAYLYLLDTCDGAGVWKANLKLMSFNLGEGISVSREELETHLGSRFIWVGEDRLWLTRFIKFQYKSLSANNSAQRGIMKQVIELTRSLPLDAETEDLVDGFKLALAEYHSRQGRPSGVGHSTPESGSADSLVKETVKEKENGEGGAGGVPKVPPSTLVAPPAEITREAIDECILEWLETLGHFKAGRSNITAAEELEIANAIRRQQSVKAVKLALRGIRYQQKSETYDPSKFLNLRRLLHPDSFDRLLNLGTQSLRAEAS